MSEQSKVRSVQDMESLKKFLSANMDKNFKLIVKESFKASKNKTREEKKRSVYDAITGRYSKAEMRYNKFMYSAYYYMRTQDRIKKNGGIVTEEDYKRLSYLSKIVTSQDVSSSIPEKDRNKDKELLSQPMLLTQRIFQHEEKKMERYVKEVAKFPVELQEMYGYADRKDLAKKIDPKLYSFDKAKKFAGQLQQLMKQQGESAEQETKEFEEFKKNMLEFALSFEGMSQSGEDVLKIGNLLDKIAQSGAEYKKAVNPDGKTVPDSPQAQAKYTLMVKVTNFAMQLMDEFPSEKRLEEGSISPKRELDEPSLDGPSLEDRLALMMNR